MSDADADLGADYWRFVAYMFGGIALVCWVVFAILRGESGDPNATPWLWMAAAVVLTIFSATCAVLKALKSMEARLQSGLYLVRREDSRRDV